MFIRHIKLKYLLLIGVMTFQIEAEQNQNYTNNNNQQSEQNIQQVIQQSKFNTNNINSQIQNNQQPNSNNNQQLQTTQSVASSTIQSSQTIPQSTSVTTQNSNNNQQLQRNTNQVNNTQIVNSNDNIKKIEEIFNFAIEKFLMKKDNKEFYKFHGLIYKYVKKQLDNGINLETIDNAWKNILKKYEGNQNILNIKSTYNLSSITNIINYYIDMLGENRRNLILNSNGPNEFTQNLIKIIELLIGDKEKLLKNDLEKMFKIIFINNKQEILNKLIGLHQVSSNESINLPYGTSINIIKSPLFINDLYNQISNLKNLEELIAYYNNHQ